MHRYSTINHAEYDDVFKYLPAVGVLGLVIGPVCPYDVLELHGREKFYGVSLSQCFAPPNITWCMKRNLQVFNTPEIWGIILRGGSRRYLYAIHKGYRGSLAFVVDATAGR